jgi:peptide/nickel transport system permease protein
MTQFIVRRLLIAIPTMIGITMVLFAVISAAPGDPFGEIALNPNVPPETRALLKKQLGIDQPIYVRYYKWVTSLAKGNWGVSFVNRVPVTSLIRGRLPTTIMIVGAAYLFALLIALPVGIVSAVKQYSIWDNVATTMAFLGYSLPTFFTGLVFILLFTVKLHWLPEVYRSNISGPFFERLKETARYAAMPVMVLALFQAAELTRYVRSSVLDVVHLDYIRTARAKGLGEMRVTLAHAVRNALIPVVTIMAIQIPTIFTGALVTEQIFRVPGIGTLLLTSINGKDTPVIMAIVLVYAAMVVLFSLIADVLYGVLDPRIKYA